MKHFVVITVGTSLFHSATWRCEGSLAGISGYKRWTEEKAFIESPRLRDRDPALVSSRLGDLLTEDNSEELAAFLPDELAMGDFLPKETMRFSAEIASLVKLAAVERCTPAELLKKLDGCYLPADPLRRPVDQKRNPSYVAAVHLKEYFDHIAGAEVASLWGVTGLASLRPKELVLGLEDLLERLRSLEPKGQPFRLDLLIAGGFKVYGTVLAPLALGPFPGDVRVHYIHEAGRYLVSLEGGQLVFTGSSGQPLRLAPQYGPLQ